VKSETHRQTGGVLPVTLASPELCRLVDDNLCCADVYSYLIAPKTIFIATKTPRRSKSFNGEAERRRENQKRILGFKTLRNSVCFFDLSLN
jgi:hypothetical protein